MFAVVLDEESARVGGLPVDGLNSLLAALAAITVVAAMRVVGILLVAALMVLPVATAQLVARSFRSTLWMSAVIGASAAVAGLAAARIWGLAPGGRSCWWPPAPSRSRRSVSAGVGPGRRDCPGWARDCSFIGTSLALTGPQIAFLVALSAIALLITFFALYVASSTVWGDRWYRKKR